MNYDTELRRHNEQLRRAAAVRPADHVLDVGCGAGLTTREAARAAARGSALGVDTSAPAIEHARALAAGLGNIAFEVGDAQAHPFPAGRFDLAISRFGTMFFADPVAAFANIGRALRPGGRLVMMVWQAGERNEWNVALDEALGATGGAGAFSLGDPATVAEILTAAGFGGVGLEEVREPLCFGPDLPSALEWVGGFTSTAEALRKPGARERLRETLAAHLTGDGVWFDSRAWIVTANRD
ncbi:class I SAM-dependent methyltransferase [Paractinoplanes rhizophilus]|uniref:Class I SAM-dependent methyltransferase n=1 Tax=Paractinoplanes rhizophilus TaxID=1416877 RepID=A0ABW2HNW6_9ACTN